MMRLVLNTIAVGGGMAGAVLVANGPKYAPLGYCLFLASSATSVALLWEDVQQRALLALNVFYGGVNIYGLARWSEFI